MKNYFKKIDIRWADLDPNYHVLHSKYYDFGAYCRMTVLAENGISLHLMQQHHIGMILLREECVFKKELKSGDTVTINMLVDKISKDYRKWTIKHEIRKNENTLAALITVDAAWMDLQQRKLTSPPEIFLSCINEIPKTNEFQFTE